MKNILFVDDDPNVLAGLRRMLRPMKKEWSMHFVESGEAALALLSASTFDAIVSDMRMPVMNGADLLRSVKQDYPNTVRIAFSGQAEQQMTLDVTTSAHQYLAKPCDAEQVRYTINRACKLRQILANDDLQRLVSGLGSLPSLPQLYQQIVEIVNSPDGSLREVGDIISLDIAMTAKILQLVNSAFFRLKQHVATPTEAASLLGIDIVKGLVLSTEVFNAFEQSEKPVVDIPQMSKFSTETAALARKITELEINDKVSRDYAFMAGMLHSVGQLLLAVNLPDQYVKITTGVKHGEREIWELEKEIFGQSHMEVGAYLLGLWGLADPIVDAVAYYRYPQLHEDRQFSPLAAVHAANALLLAEQDPENQTRYLNLDYLTELGVADQVEHWINLLQEMRQPGVTE